MTESKLAVKIDTTTCTAVLHQCEAGLSHSAPLGVGVLAAAAALQPSDPAERNASVRSAQSEELPFSRQLRFHWGQCVSLSPLLHIQSSYV